MKHQPEVNNSSFAKLRAAAEEAMQAPNFEGVKTDKKDAAEIFQELQVHQIELEMQNDELRIVNEELEMQRLKFVNLYDLAPVGYFILNQGGFIEEANAAGLQMLEVSPKLDIKKRLSNFVASECAQDFYIFFRTLISSGQRGSIQLTLLSGKGRRFHAHLDGTSINRLSQCYITLVDIDETIVGREKLADINNQLEMALQAATAGTWTLNVNTVDFNLDVHSCEVCHVNISTFDHKYQSFINLMHPDDRLAADRQFRDAISHATDVDIICRITHFKSADSYLNIRGHRAEPTKAGSLVGVLWDVTEKVRLQQEAERLRLEHQKLITTATLQAQERERKRISESLHDSVSQLLYGIRLHLSQLSKENLQEGTRHLNQLLDVAITETRNISFELAPSILEHFGLQATLEELARRLGTPQLQFKLKLSGLAHRFDLMLEHTIFRIIQELVNNCLKHSGTHLNLIDIQVRKNKQIEIVVQDNGKGFDTAMLKVRTNGTGLSSIANRVNLYNGTLDIQSEPDKGTFVKIVLNDE